MNNSLGVRAVVCVGGLLVVLSGLVCWAVLGDTADPSLEATAANVGIPRSDPDASCGLVGLAVMLRLHGWDISLAEYRSHFGATPPTLLSLADLRDLSVSVDAPCTVARFDPSGGWPDALRKPFLCHVDGSHYLVAKLLPDDRALVIDLPHRPRVVLQDSLRKRMSGYVLLAEGSEG